jgi:hypothetical protein
MAECPASRTPEEEIPQEAEAMARFLANLSGRSIAGFFPDPPGDVSLEQIMAEPALVRPLEIESQMVKYSDAHAVAHTILAATIRSTAEDREQILTEIRDRGLDKEGFYSYLLDLLRADVKAKGDVSVEWIQQSIPEYGPKVLSRPLEEWELRDCFFAWFQILNLRPTRAQLAMALRCLLLQGGSGEAATEEGKTPA